MSHQDDYSFGRSKELSILYASCDKCSMNDTIIIATDTSNGEYGELYICMDCINEIHNKFITKFKNIKKSISNDT